MMLSVLHNYEGIWSRDDQKWCHVNICCVMTIIFTVGGAFGDMKQGSFNLKQGVDPSALLASTSAAPNNVTAPLPASSPDSNPEAGAVAAISSAPRAAPASAHPLGEGGWARGFQLPPGLIRQDSFASASGPLAGAIMAGMGGMGVGGMGIVHQLPGANQMLRQDSLGRFNGFGPAVSMDWMRQDSFQLGTATGLFRQGSTSSLGLAGMTAGGGQLGVHGWGLQANLPGQQAQQSQQTEEQGVLAARISAAQGVEGSQRASVDAGRPTEFGGGAVFAGALQQDSPGSFSGLISTSSIDQSVGNVNAVATSQVSMGALDASASNLFSMGTGTASVPGPSTSSTEEAGASNDAGVSTTGNGASNTRIVSAPAKAQTGPIAGWEGQEQGR